MSIYILSGARTPQGSFLGCLASVKAVNLGATAIKGCYDKSNIDQNNIDEVFMGNVVQAGVGQAPARQAAILSGLNESIPATTINKVCGSGMKSVTLGAQSILAGANDLVISGGMENMSLAPHLLSKLRTGNKFGESSIIDSLQSDGLVDAYGHLPMGNYAEECAQEFNFTREEQDNYAIESFKRSQNAIKEGFFSSEIVPVPVTDRKGNTKLVTEDEGPFKANFDKIPKLKPAFVKNGTITAANASTINDGGAAILLASKKFKSQARFKIVSMAQFSSTPSKFTTAPVAAMKKCFELSGISQSDIDIFEINEAFAVVPMAAIKVLNLNHQKVNIFGGGIGLGHPIGASGTRILVTLMNAMEIKNANLGMASICIGGGEALSMIIERT